MQKTLCAGRGLVLILAWGLLACATAHADLTPPYIADASARLRNNPKTYDRADQFCRGKRLDDACELPGNPLQGGGTGVCRSSVNDRGEIERACVRTTRVEIDRGVPSGGFVASPARCKPYIDWVQRNDPSEPEPVLPYGCKHPEQPLTDRFCKGKAVGDACAVELRVDGRPEQYPGACTNEWQSKRFYNMGWVALRRQVMTCASAPAFERQFSPASWLDKLWQ
ncbi:hypothetical protein WI89_07065 [Burkholderia ubonensis]|uniref:hypothetical protein n=1 Tax=Burkholderia ubonensis TaxID=101571 RepID=UPI000770D705|nr:hypothetical protein [Burkholderia ubonensis]KVD76188.1 hypothetical protein WI89_07065 [Burkholderia ubonensis]